MLVPELLDSLSIGKNLCFDIGCHLAFGAMSTGATETVYDPLPAYLAL